jgi:NADH-quinone oxidoreductase subunit A
MQPTQLTAFGVILLFIIGGILFFGVAMLTARLLRPHRPNAEKLSSYECGEEVVGSAWGPFNVRYYIVALVFILFDVELAFLFPWAVVFGDRKLDAASGGLWSWYALTEMFIFVAVGSCSRQPAGYSLRFTALSYHHPLPSTNHGKRNKLRRKNRHWRRGCAEV